MELIKQIVTIEGTGGTRVGRRVVERHSITFYITGVSYADGPGYKIKKFSYSPERSKAAEFSKLAAEAIKEQLSDPRSGGRYYPSCRIQPTR